MIVTRRRTLPNARSTIRGMKMRHEANGTEAGGPKITADWSMAAVTDERLHQLHTHWLALCGGRRMPSRGEFDPVHVPRPLLPHINLVDVMDPLDFRFRLVGTHWHDFVGQEVRGKLIGEVFPPRFLCRGPRTLGRRRRADGAQIGQGAAVDRRARLHPVARCRAAAIRRRREYRDGPARRRRLPARERSVLVRDRGRVTSGGAGAYITSTTEPVVLRASRSRCACAASLSA